MQKQSTSTISIHIGMVHSKHARVRAYPFEFKHTSRTEAKELATQYIYIILMVKIDEKLRANMKHQ